MKRLSQKQLIGAALAGVVLLASVLFFLGLRHTAATKDSEEELFFFEQQTQEEEEELDAAVFEEKIMVDMKGAISHPGVYQLEEGSRVYEAISEAGGLLEVADENKVNLAAIIEDEMVIYIPEIGEDVEEIPSFAQQQGGDKIDLNKATAAELEQIPGIGPAKAGAILSYREEHGSFGSVDDLLQVSALARSRCSK